MAPLPPSPPGLFTTLKFEQVVRNRAETPQGMLRYLYTGILLQTKKETMKNEKKSERMTFYQQTHSMILFEA